MPIGGSRPDELLWLSGGGLYVAPLLAIPALFVDYVIASRTEAVVPFLIPGCSVLPRRRSYGWSAHGIRMPWV
jgi:hypothetical protein